MIATRLLTDRLPKRRQQPRHADKFDMRGQESPLAAAQAESRMSPAQQIDAALKRHSGPQAAIAGFVPGAEPPEDDPRGEGEEPVAPPQPSFTPRPTGPQPLLGTQPARRIRKTAAPVRPVSRVERDVLERVRDGLEQMDGTHPYAPSRTEADRIRQDAARPRTPGPIRPLPPETPMAAEPVRIRHAAASGVRVGRLAYPAPDGFSRHAREYADLMRHVSFITGTTTRYETPAAWGAATIAIGGAA